MASPGVPIDGRKLRAARIERRMSTSQVAEQVNCSSGHVRLMERGVRKPSVSLLGRLEQALGVTAEQLDAKLPV